MNILHTICSLRVGGAEKLLVDTVNNLPVSESDNVYICILNNVYDNELVSKIKNINNVFFLERVPSSFQIKPLIEYFKLIKRLKVDIIHVHENGSRKLAILSKIINRKVKIIYTIHDTNFYNKLSKIQVIIDKIFISKFIAISEAVKKNILEQGVKDEKVSLIYNGVDISKYINTNVCREPFSIGCVARILPAKKGQDVLIKAVAILKAKYPQIKCYFAGDVPSVNGLKDEKSMNMLKQLIKENDLRQNIIFLGNVSNIPNFLSKISVFVLPSRYEGFGLSIIEAMANKVPVIASNIDGPREIIKDKYGLTFVSENFEELAEKIQYCFENDMDNLVCQAYEYAKENYDISAMCKSYMQLYNTLCVDH